MINTYYIGGSPCAGKSTAAEILSEKYNLYYFKVDDFLDGYTKSGALKGYPICKKNIELNAEQIWMREPSLQCAEEFEFYKEIFEYVLADLQKIRCENGIITEGAAYIPNLMKHTGQQIHFHYPRKRISDFPFPKESICSIYLGRMQR